MISVIIPFYNSDKTLKECLDSVFNNKFGDFEVITVSDKSTDGSIDIAKNYNCKIIELDDNKGPAFARNTGANFASGNILFFLDSDCVIKNDALFNVDKTFRDKEINVLQGVYNHKPNYKSISTQYQQSFYCYFAWHEYLIYTDNLISMCFAIKKKIFIECEGFNTNILNATAEDDELGYTLAKKGHKILILRELIADHRVEYNISKFIKRNFRMYSDIMKTFIRNKTYINKINQKNYSNVLIRIPILGLIIFTLLMSFFFQNNAIVFIFLSLNIIFLFLHLGFINFIKKTKGTLKSYRIIPICYLDTFLMILGSIYGIIGYSLGKKY